MKPRILPTARLSFPLTTAIGALLGLFATPAAHAAARTWTGGDGDWETGQTGGFTTGPWANIDTATFNGPGGTVTVKSAITTANAALAFTAGNYTLQSDVATERVVTLGNDTVTLGNGVTTTIGSNVTLSRAAALTFDGNSTATSTLNIDSGGKATNSGAAFTIREATANVNTGGTIESTASLVVGTTTDGATLNVLGGTVTVGIGNAGALFVLGNTASFSPTVNFKITGGSLGFTDAGDPLAHSIRVGPLNPGTGVVTAMIDLEGGVVTVREIYESKSTYSSTLNLHGGTLKALASNSDYLRVDNTWIKSGGAIFDSNGKTITVTKNLLTDVSSLGGGLTLNDTAATKGTLTLSGTNTYTGTTTITAGTLSINTIQDAGSATANALGQPAVGANSIINIGDAGTLKYTGTGHSSDRVVNLTALTGGAMALDASGASGTLTLTGGVTSAGTSGISTLTLTGTGLGSESAAITDGTSSNVTALTKSGTGTWTLAGNNGYSGVTTVTRGTLSISHNNALGSNAGATTISPTISGNASLVLNSATAGLAVAENLNFISTPTLRARLENTSAFNHTLSGSINVDSSAAGAITEFSATAGSINISGDITGSVGSGSSFLIRGSTLGVGGVINGNITLTGGGLTKTDNGTWTIGAAGKTYSAPLINVSAGILKMGADNYLAPSTILSLGNTFNNVGNFDLNGFSQTVGGITNIGTGVGQTITSSAGTPVLTVDNPSAYSPANLILTGSLGLAKNGSGALTLSGTNTYTGTTTVASGTLAVNGNISTSSLTTVNSGATIQGSGTVGQLTVNGTLAPGNSIESLGVGNLSFSTVSTYAYELQTDLYAGTPNVAGDLTYSSGTLNIASGTILTLTDLATSTALSGGSKLTLLSSLGAWNGGLFSYDAGAGLITLADDSDITLGANIWRFNYNDTSAGSNFTADTTGAINYVTMTVIPEPRAALLGGLGMLALLRRRRN